VASRGRFITVEGAEGVGKSTNIDYLTGVLEARGIDVVTTREPGGTPVAEKIRDLLLEHGDERVPETAELLLFFAARALNLANTVRPALERGQWVICDRFTDATRAYQGAGRGLDRDRIDTLADWVQEGLEPDLTLLLDAPVGIGLDRASRRGEADRMESEQVAFYERVRSAYLDLARSEPARITVIDASGDLASVQQQLDRALAVLLAKNEL
jgi:dTMP kinase